MSTKLTAPYRTSFNGKLDRLSSLIDRLKVNVSNASVGREEEGQPNFGVFTADDGALRLAFAPVSSLSNGTAAGVELAPAKGERQLVAAHITVTGIGRQLITALPDCLSIPLEGEPYLTAIVSPLIEEVASPRCGGQAVFERLCEVVVIRLLRHTMEQGKADAGLLRGLADPKIAAALVAIHEAPGDAWTLEKLAETAGMSRTQFSVTFRNLVGETPMGYLADWRLDIAKAELETGRQVKSVANLCGFASAAAFSRAFARRFGHPPKHDRTKAA